MSIITTSDIMKFIGYTNYGDYMTLVFSKRNSEYYFNIDKGNYIFNNIDKLIPGNDYKITVDINDYNGYTLGREVDNSLKIAGI